MQQGYTWHSALGSAAVQAIVLLDAALDNSAGNAQPNYMLKSTIDLPKVVIAICDLWHTSVYLQIGSEDVNRPVLKWAYRLWSQSTGFKAGWPL